MLYALIVWCGYCTLEVLNDTCDLGINVANWYSGARLMAYQLLYIFLVFSLYVTTPKIIHQYLWVWAAFSREDGKLVGQMWCANRGDYTVTVMGKYHPDYMKLRASDAIHYAVLTHYLNELGQRYIDSGTRNISHHTGVQDYKEINWHFRRAYCLLHIEYNPQIRWLIKCLFPLRRLLYACDRIKPVHKLNGVMRMEEIARECKRMKSEEFATAQYSKS